MSAVSTWFNERVAAWAVALKKTDVAFEYWQRVLNEDPQNARVLASVAHEKAQQNRFDEAIVDFARVVELDAKNSAAWFNHGYVLQRVLRHADAVKSFEQAVAIDAKSDLAWFGLGISQRALGDVDAALAAFATNAKLQPMSPHGFYELAKCHFELGDRNACEKTMRKVKKFDPKVAAQLEDETGISIGVERWWYQP